MLLSSALAAFSLRDRVSEPVDRSGPVKIGENLLRQLQLVSCSEYRDGALRWEVIRPGLREHIAQVGHKIVGVVLLTDVGQVNGPDRPSIRLAFGPRVFGLLSAFVHLLSVERASRPA